MLKRRKGSPALLQILVLLLLVDSPPLQEFDNDREFACTFSSSPQKKKQLQSPFLNSFFSPPATVRPGPQTIANGSRRRAVRFPAPFHFRPFNFHRENPRKCRARKGRNCPQLSGPTSDLFSFLSRQRQRRRLHRHFVKNRWLRLMMTAMTRDDDGGRWSK